MAKEEQIT